MKAFVFGLLIGILALPLGVCFYFVSGSAPVATAAGAMPFERMLASQRSTCASGKGDAEDCAHHRGRIGLLLANANKIPDSVKQALTPPNFPPGGMPPNAPRSNP